MKFLKFAVSAAATKSVVAADLWDAKSTGDYKSDRVGAEQRPRPKGRGRWGGDSGTGAKWIEGELASLPNLLSNNNNDKNQNKGKKVESALGDSMIKARGHDDSGVGHGLRGGSRDEKVVDTTPRVDIDNLDSVPAVVYPHRDGALDVDGADGELTVKESEGFWSGCLWGDDLGDGGYCGSCGGSACKSGHCHLLVCRTCVEDRHCSSGKFCNINYQCEEKGRLNHYCDPTGLTDGYFHAPCADELSCLIAGLEFKCLPAVDGCYAHTLSSYLSRVGTAYDEVKEEAARIVDEMSGTDVEEIVNSVVGDDGLMSRIRQAACATRSIVTEGVEELQRCRSEVANEHSLTATHGLDDTDQDAFIFMLGATVDATAGVLGASLGFGVVGELDGDPQLALYISACAGISIGWEFSAGVSAALQLGGGLEATRGFATEVIEPNISVGVGAGIAFSFSNSDPSYVTVSVGIGGGGGVDLDVGHQCFAWVSPTAQDFLDAATCATKLETCSDFGGVDTATPGTRCCPLACGDKCGAGNCNQGTGCCSSPAVGKVCGIDPLPCHMPPTKLETCSDFGGVDTATPGTRCCPLACGDKCGAGNCNQGTDCCSSPAVGKVCGIDPLPCHMPPADMSELNEHATTG